MSKLGSDKEVNKLIRLATEQHWKVGRTKQHIQFVPPKKQNPIVVHSLTASDHRAYANLKSQLRRSGLNIK